MIDGYDGPAAIRDPAGRIHGKRAAVSIAAHDEEVVTWSEGAPTPALEGEAAWTVAAIRTWTTPRHDRAQHAILVYDIWSRDERTARHDGLRRQSHDIGSVAGV